jgi:hypothetical protein
VNRQHSLCPAQLLEILAADAHHLKFNLHDLVLSCWELLRTIARGHDAELQASRALFWGEDAESKKSNVVDDVLWEAVLLAAMGQVDPMHPGTLEAMLFKVRPALDEFITRK